MRYLLLTLLLACGPTLEDPADTLPVTRPLDAGTCGPACDRALHDCYAACDWGEHDGGTVTTYCATACRQVSAQCGCESLDWALLGDAGPV